MTQTAKQRKAEDWSPSEDLRTLSHDLRGALGTIKSTLYVIDKKTSGGEVDLSRFLERASRSMEECETLLDELFQRHGRSLD